MSTPPADDILGRLKSLHPKVIDLSLERIERLLGALGHPERKLPPVIHVAGTNGKGSTVAFLAAIFEAAGLNAHVYTSPHLVRFNERIRLAGRDIDDAALADVLARCEAANGGQPITFFEITTAAALLAFSETPADVVILETGLGGRLDATNVVEQPALTLITPIAMDHQHFLGDTIEAIAREKAAIIKPGVACISAAQASRKAAAILTKAAEAANAPFQIEGADWFVTPKRNEAVMTFVADALRLDLPKPALAGRHQMQNAGLAVAAAEALKPRFAISDDAMATGLRTVRWPARLQPLTGGPLAAALPAGWELWLDGGHNVHAAEALSRHLRGWRDKPVWLVFGALNQRPPMDFLKPFEARVVGLRAVTVPGEENTLSTDAIIEAAAGLRMDARAADSVAAAIADITANAGPPARILICGSLYLAGHVLAQ